MTGLSVTQRLAYVEVAFRVRIVVGPDLTEREPLNILSK